MSFRTAKRRVIFTLIILLLLRWTVIHGQVADFYIRAKTLFYLDTAGEKSGNPKFRLLDSLFRSGNDRDLEGKSETTLKTGYYLLERSRHAGALELFQQMRSEFDKDPEKISAYPVIYSKILIVTGAIYEETGLWNDALDLYLKALKINNETGNKEGKAKVYLNIGNLYFNRNKTEEAEQYYRMALEINLQMGNKAELFNTYNNLAGVYQLRRNIHKAMEFAMLALSQLDTGKDFYNLSLVYTNIGCLFEDMADKPSALSYYRQAAALQERHSFNVPLVQTWLFISSIYRNQDHPDSSRYYLAKATELADRLKNPNRKLLTLKAASKYYKWRGDYRLAMQSFEAGMALKDSLENENSLTRIDRIQSVYETISKEKDRNILQSELAIKELSIQRQRIIIITSVTLILVLAYLIFVRSRNQRKEREKNELIRKQKELLMEQEKLVMKQEKRAMEENEQKIKQELDHLNRQLASYALHLTRNSEFILQTTGELKQMLILMNPRDREKSKKIREMIQHLEQYSGGQAWEDFRLYFEEVHPSFDRNLTAAFPDLSPNDKKICAFIKLGLSTKEIAAITFREPRSIETARSRLRKKLGLDNDTSIHGFLSQF
jgi:tetratricopeptide (TPR) repeat protein